MTNEIIIKCYKVNSVEERDMLSTLEGDIVYVRNHPFVYLHEGTDWRSFTKVYAEKGHPKYNLDKMDSLEEPFMFKVENLSRLDSAPAKVGDLVYRNGDPYMYYKTNTYGKTLYVKILKM